MARMDFQIWKDKPWLGASAQFYAIDAVDEYYAVGWDNEQIEDDIYAIYSSYYKFDSNLNYDVCNSNSLNTCEKNFSDGNYNSYLYGAGQLWIRHLGFQVNDNDNNHWNDFMDVYFLDSAIFQCATGVESGCSEGPTGTYNSPTSAVKPSTGAWIGDFRYDDWHGTNGYTAQKRIYRVDASGMSDCDWGGYDEYEPEEGVLDLVGNTQTDLNEDASLSYTPSIGSTQSHSGVWKWKFFPYLKEDIVTSENFYNYQNPDAPSDHSSGLDWDELILADVFSNAINTSYHGGFDSSNSPDHYFDYDGAFYIVMWLGGYNCPGAYVNDYCRNATYVYTIPKKHIYDNWNSTKRICFKWGTDFDCGDDTIEIATTVPIGQESPGGECGAMWKGRGAIVYWDPPRFFYENDHKYISSDEWEGDADLYNPVNNIGSERKNPIDKDPTHPFAHSDENCLSYGCGNGKHNFYPYVTTQTPWLYTPESDIDFVGNILGINDGTLGVEREDLGGNSYEWSDIVGSYALDNDLQLWDGGAPGPDPGLHNLYERDFRPIAYSWVGGLDIDGGLSVQRAYEVNSTEEAQSSAPNIVQFWLSLSEPISNGANINFFDFAEDFWKDDIYLKTGMGYKWCIARWGDEGADMPSDDVTILEELGAFQGDSGKYYIAKNTYGYYDWKNIKDDGGFDIFSHVYQTEGIKTIKAFVFSYIYNSDIDSQVQGALDSGGVKAFQTIHWKLVTIRIKLNLSGVFVEDFSEIGGADFKFIPMKTVSPIIGGLHPESSYIKSIDKIVSSDLFDDSEMIERIRATNAQSNDNLGFWPGKMDIEQVRLFTKPFDMHYLLDIENDIVVTSTRLRMYDYSSWWDGINHSFSNETSVGQIFINDNIDANLKSACILELNIFNLVNNKITDSSGHNNIGILLGDYSIIKEDIFEEVVRDKSMKVPEREIENGAI